MSKQETILNEAIRIGDELIQLSQHSSYGVYWNCLKADENREFTIQVTNNLYNGGSGIALFLIELFKHTGEQRFVEVAEKALIHISRTYNSETAGGAAFYTGDLGVSYAWLQLHKISGLIIHKEECIQFALSAISQIDSLPIDDFITGRAGTITGLLLLHSELGERFLIDAAIQSLQRLLKGANVAKRGLYWDKSFHQIAGLCGLSHGAGGVGISFLQAANYLNEPALFEPASLAFQYENTHFSAEHNNWMDLRKSSRTDSEFKTAQDAWNQGNLNYFRTANDMNAWCHGAAGVGLTRLLALNILEDGYLRTDLDNAIQKVFATDIDQAPPYPTFNLCHGTGGNLDLIIELNTDNGKYQEILEHIALKAIEQKQEAGLYYSGYGSYELSDPSLFIGDAGIGYFYLRVLDPGKTQSILLPKLPNRLTTQHQPVFNTVQLRIQLLSKYFPQAVNCLARYAPESLQAHLENVKSEDLFSKFPEACERISASFNTPTKAWLSAVLEVENYAYNLEIGFDNKPQQYFELLSAKSTWASLKVQDINDLRLELFHSKCFETPEVYRFEDFQAQTEPESGFVIVVGGIINTVINPLTELAYYVLREFNNPSSYQEALNNFLSGIEIESAEERLQFEQAFEQQVRTALDESLIRIIT